MLTDQEKQIVINILSQVSVPVKDAPIVLKIIEKLKLLPESVVAKAEKK